MNTLFARRTLHFSCVAVAAIFACASNSWAQGQGVGNQTQMGTMGGGMTDQLVIGTAGAQLAKDRDAAYKAFLKEQDPAKKLDLGKSFARMYPDSALVESVDVNMMNVYEAQKDWKSAYQYAGFALKLQPDDVDVLTSVSWTIPHVYDPNDPDAEQQLNTAETYAKHAIEVLAKMPKPSGMKEEQFQATRSKRTYQSHSALGLVYFRRDDYENSAKELALATQGNPTPDAADLFVLGADMQNLKRFGEAADAYGACGQIAGTLQNQCKQNATATRAQAEVLKNK
jgi:tetratricopeptide (TPR) repeat protein